MLVTREQAIAAIDLGWEQEELLRLLQTNLPSIDGRVSKVFSWGLLIDDRWIFYRGRSLDGLKTFASDGTDEIVCYADGSGTTSEKSSGIGVVVYAPGHTPQLIAENIGPGTNNRAELAAAWRALKAIPDISRNIEIRTDSQYTIGSLTQPWAAKANIELIGRIREDLALRGDRVRFTHVRGHKGVEGNEIADVLANAGRQLVTEISPL